jgi:hypothetical protein
MDLRLAALKAASFYLLHNVSILNQCRKFSCVTVVCKHFASYQDYPKSSSSSMALQPGAGLGLHYDTSPSLDYPNYKWD